MNEETKLNVWYECKLQELCIPDNVTSIHCDTRDFGVIMTDRETTKEADGQAYCMLHSGEIDERFLMKRDEIIPWLMHIEAISGGRGDWRCLNFDTIETRLGWLKYIRMYRYNDDMFLVCDSYSDPIEWRLCTEESLEKEYLNFQQKFFLNK